MGASARSANLQTLRWKMVILYIDGIVIAAASSKRFLQFDIGL